MAQEQRLRGFDIIGDIHGCSSELESLLKKLGYEQINNVYCHPLGRTAVFVGDYIDRGPDIAGVLRIVKGMHCSGNALCILGNHEYNAYRFWRPKNGEYLRKHSHTNIIQHYHTIKAFQNNEHEWDTYLDWFSTLPLYLDMPTFRVVHAYWNNDLLKISPKINLLENNELVEKCLKGVDLKLPPPISYLDKDGNKRTSARTKWWLNPSKLTYGEYIEHTSFSEDEAVQLNKPIPLSVQHEHGSGYGSCEKPVFFGHYWLKGVPTLQADNVCCLDYSVAKGDKLVCYRFDDEQTLKVDKIVYQEVFDFN